MYSDHLIIFRLKIIPLALAQFVKSFGLRIPGVEGKQYFPYKYNVPENYNVELPHLPPMV
jgi:hypothetical protein